MDNRSRARCALTLIIATLWLVAAPARPTGAQAAATKASAAARRPPATWPLTRPEATNYAETSRYDEVVAFMKTMAAANPQIHLTTYGYTYEGRPLPLAVIGAPDATPEKVRATGKTRIFVQGNIHAGEVEGKEAMLWLLRSVARGERADWAKQVVLLVNPIYNADGNERVNVRNRGSQWGPVGGMGQRHNAQDLDLNRDNTKLETAEARSMARLLTTYDPHVIIDLHTTNGSNHGFFLTYDTSASPNTSPAIANLVRKDLLPAVTKAVKAKHDWSYFYYGGVSRQGEPAWRGDLDLYKPRYTQTYWGLRNRIGILSETYSYASFEDRIKAAYRFVEEIVNYAAANGPAIRQACAAADAESIVGTPQAVRNRLTRYPNPVEIVIADIAEVRNPYVPERPMRARVAGSERTEVMPHYGLIEPIETAVAPRAYVIPAAPPGAPAGQGPAPQPSGMPPAAPPRGAPGMPGPPPGSPGAPPFMRGPVGSPPARMLAAVIDRLDAHGVTFYKTAAGQSFTGERFRIAATAVATTEYQGTHKLRTMSGAWEAATLDLPAGSLVIPMDQPLARLAFALLDPMSDDGFMTWNILDPVLTATPAPEYYPVLRTMTVVAK